MMDSICPKHNTTNYYDILNDTMVCDNCIKEKSTKKVIPQSADQVSIADSFENDLETIISKYCRQGLTVGSAIGALQNRVFHLSLNIHMASIIEVVKRNLQ